MGRGWKGWLGVAIAAGSVGLLASRAAAWLERREPVPLHEPALGGEGLAPALREEPILGTDLLFDPLQRVVLPIEPSLVAAHQQRFGTSVQHLRRCVAGDALVTVERQREGVTWVVVHRAGKPCFRLSFPDGPDQSPALLRVFGTVDPAGEAGPLAIVHGHPLQPVLGDDGLVVRREALHLIVITLRGSLLLERGLETSAASQGRFGGALTVAPLLWDGEALVAWSSARQWQGSASQCLGSLLRVRPRGPIAVAEGVPCEPTGVIDVDGDGLVELYGATAAADGPPWEAIVSTGGDFVATYAGGAEAPLLVQGAGGPALLAAGQSAFRGATLLSWPWRGAVLELPPDDGIRFPFDWDGDGRDEVVLGRLGEAAVIDASGRRIAELAGLPFGGRVDGARRELLLSHVPCGIAAVAFDDGASRCAPGDMGALHRVVAVGSSFDWTADGTPDVTALGRGMDGALWMAAWAEGDLTFAWPAEASEDFSGGDVVIARGGPAAEAAVWRMEPPRHQAPRALSLSGKSGPEVLVATPDGFAVRGVPGGEIRWKGLVEKGVLDAWALPAAGPSAVAVR